jgi:DNA-binding response OmpR family regulator
VAICGIGGDTADSARLCAQLSGAEFVPRMLPNIDIVVGWIAEAPAEIILLISSNPVGAGCCADAAAGVRRLRASGFAGSMFVLGEVASGSGVAAVLDAGADDYLRAPWDPSEVVARLRALTRRACGLMTLGSEGEGPVLDRWRHVVREGDAEVALTPREAAVLECLAQRAGRAVTREELETCVWGAEGAGRTQTNVVDVYVAYLRRKLGTIGRASLIRSVRGIGYEVALRHELDDQEVAEREVTAPVDFAARSRSLAP